MILLIEATVFRLFLRFKVIAKEWKMKYIFYRRFKGKSISGAVNIPARTRCNSFDGLIFVNNIPVFFDTSENAHNYVSIDEDDRGMERGDLTRKIRTLVERDCKKNSSVVPKMRNDCVCVRYRRSDCKKVWLWNHDFYNAPIEDLQYILHLIR